MATTRLMTLKTGKGRSVARTLKDSIDYMENYDKTEGGELISSYECDVRTADNEFLLSKQTYTALTGRDRGGVIAYHVRQSFKPGEVTAEEANRIGYELAQRFTNSKFAYIVCTHTDTSHVHNHIVWNSTALDCTKKFRNFIGSYFALRRLNDIICAEHGLSVIKDPAPSEGNTYGKWLEDRNKRKPSFQDRIRASIDAALELKPGTFEDFLGLLRDSGVTVIEGGKHLKFLAAPAEGLPDQIKKPTRCNTLKGDYTEEAIRERITGVRVLSSTGKSSTLETASIKTIVIDVGEATHRRPSLLIDIQTKIQQGKGAGYER